MNKPHCCDKCTNPIDNSARFCTNVSCECHKPQWEEEFPTEITNRFVVPKYILDQRVTEYKAELIKKIEGLRDKHGNCGCCSPLVWSDVINIIKE